MLRNVVHQCTLLGKTPDPTTVITDFEYSCMAAVRQVLGDHVITQGCFYHLTQSTWRKIRDYDLAEEYKQSDDFRQYCGMLDGLAFLPIADVHLGMAFIKSVMPPKAARLVTYFDETYVTGVEREVTKPSGEVIIRRSSPRFPPETWNVHEATISGGDRTNNICEGWNNRYQRMVGHKHPTIWTSIETIQADAAEMETMIVQHAVGRLEQKKQTRDVKSTQKRVQQLCHDYKDGKRTLQDFLKAIGYTIRFSLTE